MSQRGSRPGRAPINIPTIWWAHIRTISILTLTLTLGTTLALIAQDTLTSSKTVTLRVDGTERTVSTAKETVQTLLHQEGINLNQHDRCEPPITTSLENGMTVTISRVTCEIVRERVAVEPPVVTRWDRRMTAKPVVLRQGRPGVAMQTRVMWKKDGVISEQWTQGKRIVIAPKPTIIVRGQQPSRGLSGRRVLTMVATAYDPGPASCGPYASGYTAIGMKATKGIIAVDPRVIPLGSRVYVDGYGPAIAGDTGGAIKGHKIDVCFPTRREALNWGRRTVKVVVLE